MKVNSHLFGELSKYLLILFLSVGGSAPYTSAQSMGDIAKKLMEKKDEPKDSVQQESKKDSSKDPYKEILKDATSAKGFIDLHLKDNKVYMEVPLKLLSKPILFTGRVSQISNNKDVIAGQMPASPMVIVFSKDDKKLYLQEKVSRVFADSTSSIYDRVMDNRIDPIFDALDIKAWNPDSTGVVVDATKLFLTDKAPVTAFIPSSPFDKLFGISKLSGQFKKDLSSIIDISGFPNNVNVKVRNVYTVDKSPFTAVINASLLLLPEDVMHPRLADERIGYFTDYAIDISTDKMNLDRKRYINRFRLEPRPQDVSRMRAGQLVEPKKPIIYYIDDAFPEEWWPYLKEGVEDWQEAFEAAGFKNAIIAKRYPKNDPDFDPNDARFNCIIYSSSLTSNAMGPSWTDPRSGEIIQASVYFYHNVLELLQSWRFVQTSAADPRARGLNYDLKVLGPMLRYLVAHEVGHTLGLMHNMGASSAYTIKQLRDPQFTSKWGTTPSIMDYARYNYVAQPGDGVKDFLPPRLGVYDKYAIRWGYKPILGAKTPEDEKKTLNKWIDEKAGDRRFYYGPQQILQIKDPQSQTEDLGDDAIEASRLGINNLKITVDNLFKWTKEEDKTFDHQERLLKEINGQFQRYMGHCMAYIGGYNINLPVQGDKKPSVTPIPADKQRQALYFVIDQALHYPEWIATDEVKYKLAKSETDYAGYISNIMSRLTSNSTLGTVTGTAELTKENPYTAKDLLNDLHNKVWENSGALTSAERSMQYYYVTSLIKNLELNPDEKKSSRKDSPSKIDAKGYLFGNLIKARDIVSQRMQGGEDAGHYAVLYQTIKENIKLD